MINLEILVRLVRIMIKYSLSLYFPGVISVKYDVKIGNKMGTAKYDIIGA